MSGGDSVQLLQIFYSRGKLKKSAEGILKMKVALMRLVCDLNSLIK